MIVVLTRVGTMTGVFTRCLLKYLTIPNLELSELVKLVIRDVVAIFGEKQSPVGTKQRHNKSNNTLDN